MTKHCCKETQAAACLVANSSGYESVGTDSTCQCVRDHLQVRSWPSCEVASALLKCIKLQHGQGARIVNSAEKFGKRSIAQVFFVENPRCIVSSADGPCTSLPAVWSSTFPCVSEALNVCSEWGRPHSATEPCLQV